MSKAGYIGVTAPSRLSDPVCSLGLPLAGLEQTLGGGGRGFISARHFIYPNKFQIWRSFTRWVRGPVTGGGGSRMSNSASFVRHYSHFFQNIADVAHRLLSCFCFQRLHVGNMEAGREQKHRKFYADQKGYAENVNC